MQLSPEGELQNHNDLEPSSDAQVDWEDASDAEEASQCEIMTSTNSSQTASTFYHLKKRQVQTSIMTQGSPAIVQPAEGHERTPVVDTEESQKALTNFARRVASRAFDILSVSIEKLQRPLLCILLLWMSVWVLSHMTPVFRIAISPLCPIPGISKSTLCIPVPPAPPVNFERLLDIQSSAFDTLGRESTGSSRLSVGILRAEMATQDLSSLVRHSDLKSKDNIADMLCTIGEDAKQTSQGLTKLNAKVIGAIDEVIALNNYAMVTIEDAYKKTHSQLLQVFSLTKPEEIVVEAFTLAMDESEQAIANLMDEAVLSLQNLELLDADLGVLRDMINREEAHSQADEDKDMFLGEFWTTLGGRKKTVPGYIDRQTLLDDLGKYRKQATAHVKAALQALRTMRDDLGVLRARVASPGLLKNKLPFHVHVENIRKGLERLQESRVAWRVRGMSDKVVRMLLQDDSEST